MLISVLVRSCNDETQIAGSLAAIFSQRTEDEVEVIVCDDGSTDGTRGILAGLGGRIRLLPRPPGPYFPGRTLNALVRAARGEIAVFNNADAVPLDERWLEGLVAPLKAGAADATFANQLPRADATALVRRDYLRAFGDGQAAATWPRFFSLASAAARRADLLAHPFDETLHYSEDVEWAYRRPIRRVYVPTARVEHSHNYTMAELRRRFYGEGYADAQVFGDPSPFVCRDFLPARRQGFDFKGTIPGFAVNGASRLLGARPALVGGACIGCGQCARICPAGAIRIVNKKPVFDRKKCIKCFCCQEFCPQGALAARRGLLARLLNHER